VLGPQVLRISTMVPTRYVLTKSLQVLNDNV